MNDRLASSLSAIPQIARGQVWCRNCGAMVRVNGTRATHGSGWPKCCGYTMTIDSPDERRALEAKERK